MKKNLFNSIGVFSTTALFAMSSFVTNAQTAFDVIANSPNHTVLEQAITTAGLQSALDDPNATLTVFAPDDAAFTAFLNETGLTAAQLLASTDLNDILTYHVLGSTVGSSAINNGDDATPLNTANTLKLTVDGSSVFINQAQVNAADLSASNGVVHSLDAVLLPNETVVDVAIDNNFTTLATALTEARLIPALTDPLDTFTVFAPSDAAFTQSLADLGISAADLLANADLADILLYHVLGAEVLSTGLTNGQIADPLNPANSIKITVTSNNEVFANQAPVSMADVQADNGVVHVIDEVIFTDETVVDAAIDNGFTILTQAVVTAELLPALTDPFEEYTVFAPTDAAFTQFITDEGITAADLLSSTELSDILLYHTIGAEVLSGDLVNGPVTTLNGGDVVIDITSGVTVNGINVSTPDVDVDNGVVHAIDYVLNPANASVNDFTLEMVDVYPNPAINTINVKEMEGAEYSIMNMAGQTVMSGTINNSSIDISQLELGTYFMNLSNDATLYRARFVKK